MIFDWMPDFVNFSLLEAEYFCILMNIFELPYLHPGMQLGYLEAVLSFYVLF